MFTSWWEPWRKLKNAQREAKLAKWRSEQAIHFEVDALFLAACYLHCTSAPNLNEVLAYVAGLSLGENRFVLTHLAPLELSKQSPGGARADDTSSISVLEQFDEWGCPWACHVHSHPGRGPTATKHSQTDTAYVDRLAKAGCRILGIIVARGHDDESCCYARFYMHAGARFTLTVHGRNIEPVKEAGNHVYRILGVGNRQLPIFVPDAPGIRGVTCF